MKRKTPRAGKKRPQDAIDRVLPWRGGHTHVESRLAKAGVTFPLSMDGNNQGKEEIIEQTVNMLKAKYPELGSVHARGDLEVVREYLDHHVKGRTVARVTPFTYIRQPLQDLKKPLVVIEDDVSAEQILRSASVSTTSSDTEIPAFDLSGLEDQTKPRSDSALSNLSFVSTESSRPSRSHSMVEPSLRKEVPLRERSYSQDSAIVDTEEVNLTGSTLNLEEDDDDDLFSTPV